MAENREQWMKSMIEKQPHFENKEQAVAAALKQIEAKTDYPEIWQEPNGGKYLVANYQAWETLYGKGYKKVMDQSTLVDKLQIDDIDEV